MKYILRALLAVFVLALPACAYADKTISTTVEIDGETAREAVFAAGSNGEIQVSVTGCDVAECRWYRNGTEIPGETGFVLRIENAGKGDQGLYTFDAYGADGKLLIRVEVNVRVILPDVPASGDGSLPVWAAFAGMAASGGGFLLLEAKRRKAS